MSQRSRRTARNSQVRQAVLDSDDDSPPRSQKRRRPNRAQASQSSQNSTVYDLDELPSQSSQRSRATQLAPEELAQLVGNVIRYIFTIDHSKTVIQRQHIVSNVLTNHSKHYQNIMTQVESQLLKVFGYKLVQINDSKYILTNDVPNSTPHLTFKQKERSEMVLLLLILSHIMSLGDACKEDNAILSKSHVAFYRIMEIYEPHVASLLAQMSKGRLKDDLSIGVLRGLLETLLFSICQKHTLNSWIAYSIKYVPLNVNNTLLIIETLWAFLQQLQIVGNKNNKHPYFGDVETLVTVDFIKQQYLQKVKINDTDPPKYEYRWGVRAHNELSKEEVLEFMSKIYRRDLTWSDIQ